MANFNERLPYASSSGDPPAFEIGVDAWRQIEVEYGRNVPIGARDVFNAICKTYLQEEAIERAAIKVADVRECARLTIASLQPFFQLSYGQQPTSKGPAPAVWAEFISQFEEALGQFWIPVPPGSGDEDSPPSLANVTPSMLSEFSIRISAALQKIEKGGGLSEVFEGSDGVQPGSAFRRFLGSAKEWAAKHNLPRSTFNSIDDEAAPFSRMLYCVNRLFPKDLRVGVTSAAAMAQRIRRSR
ncbi:hypothetical protein [Sinorhizobium meliloti]|uniref:hypothetical protein n=1 Tax=Rhizobium meliloti TaxID=382 RepID=UPI000FD91A98|nr:hypothetical protein [Sinorhizobium meliloti]RVG89301.1 hypothetical protein CN219_02355 [Sinorhizobium meliloti]RVI33950.1 hypothetical protein CN197_16890 [Sinorhizobium meliloti]RVI45058.1 hypothetical protein CN196_13915 [Sinorhizobium meliloti]RVJ30173.1 hypothetical protein CN177_03750 [Sinorhizobium meliloti]RVK03078.1 hypothetical protein CN170_05425 [Sinorhizobium meliloti]